MHPRIFAHFDLLAQRYGLRGSVLEVGATGTPDTLLNLPTLRAATRRIGINLDPHAALPGIEFVTGNANHMPWLKDAVIDAVLCNSTLEHDARFWLTLSEIRRVLKPGGVFLVGVPGYAENRRRRLLDVAQRVWRHPLPGAAALEAASASTRALIVHRFPADYYRFGADAVREVFLEGMDMLEFTRLMDPPRFVAVGRRR